MVCEREMEIEMEWDGIKERYGVGRTDRDRDGGDRESGRERDSEKERHGEGG